MEIITVKNYKELCDTATKIIANQVTKKPNSVLGLATGSSPIGVYGALIAQHAKGKLDFSQITTFNLDEYCGLSKTHSQSYYSFMCNKLFDHINIKKSNINFLNGKAKKPEAECESYENKIKASGGIDLQLLGVGHNGHIAFNEPSDVFQNKTHPVTLAQSTINANSRFFTDVNEVPKAALTMGIGTIMSARKILLIAGPDKKGVIDQLRNPIVSPQLPVSILHYHPDCTIIFQNA